MSDIPQSWKPTKITTVLSFSDQRADNKNDTIILHWLKTISYSVIGC